MGQTKRRVRDKNVAAFRPAVGALLPAGAACSLKTGPFPGHGKLRPLGSHILYEATSGFEPAHSGCRATTSNHHC